MKCPACFNPLPSEPRTAVCGGSCDAGDETWADDARGYRVQSKPVFRIESPLPVACPQCSQSSSQEVCPCCAYPIPAMCRDGSRYPRPGTFLAMAGARATGKSLTIATMIQQFKLLVNRHWQHPLTPLGSTGDRFDAFYMHPLYRARQVMEPTLPLTAGDNPTREPLIFSYRGPGPDGVVTDRILAIRDVAGEDLEAMAAHAPGVFGFFARADAVITLLDPLKVEEIQHFLAGLVPPPDRLGGDGLAVLANVIRLIVEGAGGPADTPALGVAISKFDVLQQLSQVQAMTWPAVMGRPGAPMQRDPSLTDPHYDLRDADLLHHEVLGLLQMLRASSVLGMVQASGLRSRYFATSALGASPSATSLSPTGIAPFRVLDPLKWAISGAVVPQ